VTEETIKSHLKEAEQKCIEWMVDNLSAEQIEVYAPLLKEYQRHMIDYAVTAALNDLTSKATITLKTEAKLPHSPDGKPLAFV